MDALLSLLDDECETTAPQGSASPKTPSKPLPTPIAIDSDEDNDSFLRSFTSPKKKAPRPLSELSDDDQEDITEMSAILNSMEESESSERETQPVTDRSPIPQTDSLENLLADEDDDCSEFELRRRRSTAEALAVDDFASSPQLGVGMKRRSSSRLSASGVPLKRKRSPSSLDGKKATLSSPSPEVVIDLDDEPKDPPRPKRRSSSSLRPNCIISEEQEEQEEAVRHLTRKHAQWTLPPQCVDVCEDNHFQVLEQCLFPEKYGPSALRLKETTSPSMASQRESPACGVAILYSYDSTSFRLSAVTSELEEQRVRMCTTAVGVIFYPVQSKQSYFFSFKSTKEGASESSNDQSAIHSFGGRKQFIQQVLENERITKVGYDFHQILQAFLYLEIEVGMACQCFDIKLACWVWNPELPSFLFQSLVDRFLKPQSGALRPLRAQSSSEMDSPTSEASNIQKITSDFLSSFRLYRALSHQLNEQTLTTSFQAESRVVPCIAKMEFHGMAFNENVLLQHQRKLEQQKDLLAQEAAQLLKRRILLSSPPDVATALYSDLGLPKPTLRSWQKKKGVTFDTEGKEDESYWEGATKDSVLQGFAEQGHRFPQLVLEYRKCKHLLSNWVSTLPSKVHADRYSDGPCIYTHWNQTATSTGRISSTNPNMQSLPKQPTAMGSSGMTVNVRDSFVARPGYVLVAADYSQLEMRILAHVTDDSFLSEFFATDGDIHTMIASRWLEKPVSEISSVERDRSKQIVYGIVYGIGSVSLGEMLGVDPPQATKFIYSFLDKFPDINSWTKQTVLAARKSRMVRTLMNRRRLLPFINSTDRAKKKRSERQAINTPIQGTASDIIKAAMSAIDRQIMRLPDYSVMDPPARMLLHIHDEIVFEVASDQVKDIVGMIQEEMESAVCLTCSIPVRVSQGTSFGSLKTVEIPPQSPFVKLLRNVDYPYIVRRGRQASCVLATTPACVGHCVVFPHEPRDSWEKLPGEVLMEITTLSQTVALALRTLYSWCVRVDWVSSVTRGHTYFHILPSNDNDSSTAHSLPDFVEVVQSLVDQEELTNEATKLREYLENTS